MNLQEAVDAGQRALDAALLTARSFKAERDTAQTERDRLQRLFNRLEAAISHHKALCEQNDVPDTHDEALWAARDRVLKDAHEGKG